MRDFHIDVPGAHTRVELLTMALLNAVRLRQNGIVAACLDACSIEQECTPYLACCVLLGHECEFWAHKNALEDAEAVYLLETCVKRGLPIRTICAEYESIWGHSLLERARRCAWRETESIIAPPAEPVPGTDFALGTA